MIWLTDQITFPNYNLATPEGVLALGGDLSSERLIYAYQNGIFPWFSEGDPIVWYCPPKRMVLFPKELRVSSSMRKIINKNNFTITENTAFKAVIFNCKTSKRKDDLGTWITDEMEQAYINLHQLGIAKSIEVWKGDLLVGGLYGVEVGGVFCGESMFSSMANTSKLAFIHLVQNKKYQLIDCQVYNSHLASLGAREIARADFLRFLT